MDVIVLPIYNREATLSITLDLIGKTAEHQQFYYLFVADCGYRSTVIPVANQWLQSHRGEIYKIGREQAQSPVKQSYALYRGYHRALELTTGFVFLIEDDIAVSNRFFEWHYKILEKTTAKLSIATKQRDVPYPIPADHTNYIIKSDYQSLGVCWRSDSLRQVLELFTPAYWRNPFGYINQIYPELGQFVASQDGVIHKHILANKWDVAFPIYPKAFHFGAAGLNRPLKRFTGVLNEKKQKILHFCFDADRLKLMLRQYGIPLDPYFYDSIPINLVQPEVVLGEPI